MATSRTARSSLFLVIVAMTIGNAVILISQTAVPLALPSIMSEFGVGSQAVQWVLTASLLPLAGFMVLGGRMGDLFGLRRSFMVGSAVFAAASVAAGVAPSFEVLVVARALQGVGGALLLPNSVAIVSSAASAQSAGRALGALGGAAAVAGAFGPIMGGGLTGVLGWRSVMLINLPLALLSVVLALRVVPPDREVGVRPKVDLIGSVLLCLALVGVIFGLTQSQVWGWTSPGVIVPLVVAVAAGAAFVVVEHRIRHPLLDFRLLARHRNYAGATISQGLGGMVEMGLGVIFPLLLILNLGMEPTLAGLALLPTTLPMVIVAPLAGRWYDKVGGRVPLIVGFGLLAGSGVALLVAADDRSLLALLPGLVLYGTGLALVLTVNDPVALDSVPQDSHGQASGVAATAEQFGGALGIAVLYLLFHATYVTRLHELVNASPLADLTDPQYAQLRDDIVAAESTGLDPSHFDPNLQEYLQIAFEASAFGYSAAFIGVIGIGLLGILTSALLVRKAGSPDGARSITAGSAPTEGSSVNQASSGGSLPEETTQRED